MIRRLPAMALALLFVLGLTAMAGSSDVLLDALLQRPQASATTVVPDRFLRRWDPITVFFNTSKGPNKGGPEDTPTRFVTLSEDHPGAWTWLDGKTLQFKPADPWTPMSAVSVRVEDRSTELFSLSPPPTQTVPRSGARDLQPVSAIEMVFADPLPAKALARRVSIELRPLPGLSDDGLVILDSDDFEIKTHQRTSLKDPSKFTIVLHEPIDRGLQARLRVGLSLDTAAVEAVHEVVFSTAQPFRAVKLGCGSTLVPLAPTGSVYPAEQPLDCRDSRQIQVNFNARPMNLTAVEVRNLVRLEPAIESFDFEQIGNSIRVKGAFVEGQQYSVTLAPTAVLDDAGRALDMTGPSTAHIVFPRREPYVKWGAGQGIAERFGPKKVPLIGRGTGQIDLRIYAVDPLNRELWPFPAAPVAVDERSRPPGPGEEPLPLTDKARLDTSGLRQRLKALGGTGLSQIVDVGLQGGSATLGLDLAPSLERLDGAKAPGHYLVGLRRLDGAAQRHWMRVQVTDLALTTIETGNEVRFEVSSLSTGSGVAGATVRLQGFETRDNKATEYKTLFTAKTDGSGAYIWTPPTTKGRTIRLDRIVVSKGDDTLVLDPKVAPERFEDGHWNPDGNTWLQWAFQGKGAHPGAGTLLGHLFSERPVYRPEEPVFLTGYVRERFQGRLKVKAGKGQVVVFGPGGAEWSYPVTLSSTGSFSTTFDESDIPTGTYSAIYRTASGVKLATVQFQVEAYRLPTFEVELDTPEDKTVVGNDAPFDITATASYYAGGKVATRPVRWSVTQFPYPWAPEGPEGFLYSSDGRYSRSNRFDSTPALSRSATTDRLGSASLTLDPSIEPNGQPRTYVVEATVTGADEQTVTAVRRIHAVPAFTLGLKVPRYQEQAKTLALEALALGPDGAAIEGQRMQVRLLQKQWHSVLQASDFSDGIARYVTDVVEVPVTEVELTSGKSPKTLNLDLLGSGVYVVELEAQDALGRTQFVRVDLYAGGQGSTSWSKPEQGVFEITRDKNSYEPGETAKLVLRSPFQSGQALVVIEAPDGNIYKRVVVQGGQATVDVKVKTGWVPRIPVHVLLRRGRSAESKQVGGMDLGKPQELGATHWLPIDPVENTVEVALSHPERAMPGDTVDVTVSLKDPSGKPVSGEVTLWLVDQAVLALGKEARLDPKPDFILNRVSRLTAHGTRNSVFGRLPFSEMPGGDGGDDESDEDGVLDKATIRKNFKSVPYYEAALAIDGSGSRTVKVALPDNLTVFKLRAKATSGQERFGSAKSSIRVRLPVLVQADLPRFVRPGDQLEIAALGRVVEGAGGSGTAEVKVEGLTLTSDPKTSFAWSQDEAVRLAWPVEVPTPAATEDGSLSREVVTVTMGAKRSADGASDAVQIALPLLDDRRVRTDRELLVLDGGDIGALKALEDSARKGSLRRTATLSDHPGIAKMAASMDILMQRPARSTDQRLDRARAWLGLGTMRKDFGMEGTELVDAAVGDALGWIPSVVDGNGLVASWPGGRGHVGLTADALLFLVDAKENRYPVDETLRTRLVRSLKSSLRSDYRHFLDGASWLERSQALEALASAGAFEEPYFNELGDNARLLGPDGTAHILLAADRGGRGDSPVAAKLQTKLDDEIILGLFQGEERYTGLKSRRSNLSPLIVRGEAQTMATMTRSLVRTESTSEKLPLLVDALVRVGGNDGWGGRADAPALLALADRMQSRSAKPVAVEIGGTSLSTTTGTARQALNTAGEVSVKNTGSEPAAVFSAIRYIPAGPGSTAESRSKGFVVSREHTRFGDGAPETTPLDEGGRELSLSLGQIVEDHVQVVNPEARGFVVVEVPLAAGLELLNPSLATSPPEATPSKEDTLSPTWVKFGDASVLYCFEWLPKGTYDFYFRSRATTAGRFVQPPAFGEVLYNRAVTGNSAGAWVVVE